MLDEHAAAIGSIEAVPVELRPAKARALLGKLYLQSGLKRNAITAFESALDKDPLCLEVVEPLQRLKASQQDFEEDDAMDSTNEKYPLVNSLRGGPPSPGPARPDARRERLERR